MEKTTSDWEARELGESARFAPMSRRVWALEIVRLKTVTEYPALIRCPHIDRPMTPVPIQPIRVVDGLIGSGEMDLEDIGRRRRREKEERREGERGRRRSSGICLCGE